MTMLNKKIATDFKLFTHKTSLNEVFIKHMSIIDDNQLLVKLRIYNKHENYDDVITTPDLINPMFRLECCRQAETYVAHSGFSLPLSFKFILKSWSLTLSWENYIKTKKADHNEICIHIQSDVSLAKRDKLRNNSYFFSITYAGVVIGEACFKVGYMRNESYLKLRGQITPDSLAKENNNIKLPAKSLGYNAENNAMLYNYRLHNQVHETMLIVPEDNITYSDHYQDHITGFNLVEGTKQFCFFYLSQIQHYDISTMCIAHINSVFEHYTENNLPTYLFLKHFEKRGNGEYEFIVSIMQEGKCKALCTLQLKEV
ncbi:A-factor biosynthesis hotdog protein [Serratia fonticola]|uniref:A-factor biosynthesis hotdog protein n=1 Tax=Serratia fonticola TaxID=47917 RepID=A0A559TAE8_SERFO|nr:AfsA-related hotdog domain-containing protein [Serratia fonticola]TQI80890.1 A-factor biosynthesis hotdog protein [Serratia fonticola]TQI97085.1 A-factor biosynthesis hotdog protein [Serratia fonticola]TVZ71581.1 A-factor biosynthesis hotdog protein [Serratia fonticola]